MANCMHSILARWTKLLFNKEINRIIKRYNLKLFIKGGGKDVMDYRIPNAISEKAKMEVEQSMFLSRVNTLNKKIADLKIDSNLSDLKTCLTADELNTINQKKSETYELIENLTRKKDALAICKENALSRFELSEASGLVKQLDEIETLLNDAKGKSDEINKKLSNSEDEFNIQMEKLKSEVGDNCFSLNLDVVSSYPENVINGYKENVAQNAVSEFVSTLSDQQISYLLNEKNELSRYIKNVGENI